MSNKKFLGNKSPILNFMYLFAGIFCTLLAILLLFITSSFLFTGICAYLGIHAFIISQLSLICIKDDFFHINNFYSEEKTVNVNCFLNVKPRRTLYYLFLTPCFQINFSTGESYSFSFYPLNVTLNQKTSEEITIDILKWIESTR